jgi:AcrR family transcriptional regulator
MSSDTQRPVMRTSERGAATRGALLEAAKEIFVTSGFAEAGVTEVVARANASVGSLYHHFSGKAELYTALFDEFQDRQTQRTKQATQAARAEGETNPMRLLIAGARAYLEGCIAERDLSALFLRGDGPPGFEVYMRQRLGQWVKRNAALFEEDEGALAVVITGALAAVAQEVSLSEDVEHARRLAEQALAIIGGIGHPAAPAES